MTACSRSEPDKQFSNRIAEKVAGPEGSQLRIADIAPEQWSLFCVFPPYSDRKRIESALGFSWETADETGIDVQEGGVLLVVVDGKKVDIWVMHPRDEGDFAQVGEPYCRERDDAVFVTSKATDGRIILKHAS